MAALAQGRPLYDDLTLEKYVQQDLALIDSLRPDIVIGDFRLSLSVSARLRKIPYLAITNAYWSPYARQRYIAPVLPFTGLTGPTLATILFRLVRPLAFALHTLPMNRVRRHHGLPSLGADLRRVYTDADYTLYADVPELFPTHDLPAHHRYLGPILWSPPVARPPWWNQLPSDKPLIYLTLGSSGANDLLPSIIHACADLPVCLMVAGAGTEPQTGMPGNVYWADYLPGIEAAARSSLVICNGGSPTSQQALAAGVPVIGIASNLDQMLNMRAILAKGAGHLLRADSFRPEALRKHVFEMLDDPRPTERAREIRDWFARYPAPERFARLLEEIVPR